MLLLEIIQLSCEIKRFISGMILTQWLLKMGSCKRLNAKCYSTLFPRLCTFNRIYQCQESVLSSQIQSARLVQTHSSEKGKDVKFDILEASLKHVKNHGWSETALKHGIADLELSDACISMFQLGGVEIALHYDKTLNEELEDMMAQQQDDRLPETEPPPIAHFLKDAIKTRLELQLPFYDRWAEALALVASPNVIPRASEQFASLIDDIWFYAGDKSTNINWYTRRATVAAVYRMTELFMMQDESPDFADTWAFLDRRLGDLEKMGENRLELENELKNMGDITKAAFIIARNMLGR